MAQVLSKEYECLTCHEPIKIAKLDNVEPGQKKKWQRFETDGVTPHQCRKKEQEQDIEQLTEDNKNGNLPPFSNSQIADLTKQVSELRNTVHILVSQITMLRGELKKY